MSVPSSDFSATIFARAHGSEAYDRLEAEVDTQVADAIAANRRVAAVFQRAAAELRQIGRPAHLMVHGYDWADLLDRLADNTPDLGRDAVARLRRDLMDAAQTEVV